MKNRFRLKMTSRRLTILLFVICILMIGTLWSLFISGPSRVYEESYNTKIKLIESNTEGIKGLTRHVFDYVTYQGYTTDTLYWFDDNGDIITTREMSDLDYDKAKEVALDEYEIDCQSIVLGYGYNNPVYEIRGKDKLILIDFDTFVRVYEREL